MLQCKRDPAGLQTWSEMAIPGSRRSNTSWGRDSCQLSDWLNMLTREVWLNVIPRFYFVKGVERLLTRMGYREGGENSTRKRGERK
ncbi:hypothetical protein ElyMa_005621700 [Elysia marginata]|uniref:Uncharacterized protein n=1 Tax=Elysia marginata TaxID=1093978 RepID=A0AAV4F8K3_9GAST|nr:hypothetical protein ElyMa_005621700 [Elysia marginata]